MIRVLICDDDATSRHLVKRAVSRTFNARLFEASDGLEALDTLQTESIDLVVTEVELPLMDGLDVVRAMRASPSSASIPVLIISAHRHADTVQEAARLHVSDYVIKPIDVDLLTNRLGKIVRTLNERSATPRRNLGGVGPNASGMIVDGDSEFRHYFKSVVGSRCVLSMAQCGSQALRAC